MSYLRYVARRAAFAILSVYMAIAATFFLGNLTIRDEIENVLAFLRYGGASPEEVAERRQELVQMYGLDEPIHERFVSYLVDVTTLDLGTSLESGRPLTEVLAEVVPTTLEYVVPGVLLAVVLGVLFGLFAALAKDGPLDWSVRLTAYVFLGVPVFMLLYYMLHVSGWYLGVGPVVVRLPEPNPKTLGALAVGLSLLAGQLRFSRAAALEQSGQAFVKMLRAKGAGRLRLARHVLRNAAIPIVSLSITELLAVLVLNIYVIEAVLPIRGLAGVSLEAAKSSDLPVVIWTTMVVVFLGITLNFLQDVLYGYLDPRIRAG
ncbi:ABC transporter permease [Halobacteriales archaeon Cl-PHB]